MKNIKSNDFFTFVELTVVLTMIVTLLALLVPALKRVNDVSETIGCGNNLRQILILTEKYCDENMGQYPFGSINQSSGGGYTTWDMHIRNKSYEDRQNFGELSQIFVCPSDTLPRVPGAHPRTYCINRAKHSGSGDNGDAPRYIYGIAATQWDSRVPWSARKHMLIAPQETLLFTEKTINLNNLNGASCSVIDSPQCQKGTIMHKNGTIAQYGMADGHVLTSTPEETIGISGTPRKPNGIWTVKED